MAGPCATTKTLFLSFLPPTIPPANGYTVKWRVVGDIAWNTVSGFYSSPISISGVPDCFNLEGTIEANCAGGGTSPIVTFSVVGNSASCYNFILLDTAVYTYTPCGSSLPNVVENLSSDPTTICALQGSISGGSFTFTGNSCAL